MANKLVPAEADGRFWVMNHFGTVNLVTDDQFENLYKDAGYNKLKVGEKVPLQQAEVDAEAERLGISAADVTNPSFFKAEPANPKDIKSIRRFTEELPEDDEE